MPVRTERGASQRHLAREFWKPLGCAIVSVAAAPLQAAETTEISGSVALVSDYRYRGESQSDGPALQGSLMAELPSGWSLELWGSTLGHPSLRLIEADLSAGRTLERGRTSIGFFADLVGYTGQNGSYAQARTLISRSFGLAMIELELSGAPSGMRASSPLYSGLTASRPVANGLTIAAHAGVDMAARQRADWSLAGSWQRAAYTVTLCFAGSTRPGPERRAALLVSVARNVG